VTERSPRSATKNKKPGARVSGELLFEDGERAALDTVNGARIMVDVPIKN
jgi:hypothetical protein